DQHNGLAGNEPAIREIAAPLPLELQTRLARIIGAIDHAAAEVKAALGTTDLNDLRYFARSHSLFVPNVLGWSAAAADIAKLDTVDVNRMADAAAILAKV